MPDLDPVAALWVAVVLTMSGLVVAALWPVPPRRAALALAVLVVVGVVLVAVLTLLFSPLALAVLVLPLIAGVVGLLAASVHRWETARDVERERLSREASPSTGVGAEAGARGTEGS